MTIQIDIDDTAVKCLNIPSSQLPTEMLVWLENNEPYEYMDTSDLKEHMYNPETIRVDVERQFHAEMWEGTISEIEDLMVKHGCAYFRVINNGIKQ